MKIVEYVGSGSIALIIMICACLIAFSKKDLTQSFLDGAKSGLDVSISLLPSLVMLVCGVKMLFASGFVDIFVNVLKPVFDILGVPAELASMVVVRPFSGSASTALAQQIYDSYGPDSFVSRCLSVIMGSSDTIFYTIGMYFSAVKIKKTRYTVAASLLVFLFCTFSGVYVCKKFFY